MGVRHAVVLQTEHPPPIAAWVLALFRKGTGSLAPILNFLTDKRVALVGEGPEIEYERQHSVFS